MKSALFHKEARKTIQKFPKEIKLALGKAILSLQIGSKLEMPLSRPMKQIGKGVSEIRLKDPTGAYRVFYLTQMKDRIVIFHAFKKKTQKTPQKEIELGKQRFKELFS